MQVDIDVNSQQMNRAVRKFMKELQNPRTAKRIHKAAGKPIEDAIKGNITDSRTAIEGFGKRKGDFEVKPGTYGRSIKTWQIKKGGTDYFVGPQTGKRAKENEDAWFQTFVEDNQTYFAQLYGGNGGNRNVGAVKRGQKQGIGPAGQKMLKQYKKAVQRAAKQASTTK
jgi:hypothetical protein